MSIWRHLTRGLRVLGNRSGTDAELTDEVRHYFDQTVASHVARGRSPEEARRVAQRELGNVTVVREQIRSYGWENAVDTVVTDLRYALRRLRSNPGFTIVAVVTLALGIGASTAIFSAVYPILFEPLPYPAARRLVSIADQINDGSPMPVTFGNYRELVVRSRSFDGLAVSRPWQPTFTAADHPERFDGQRVSANYLRTIGVTPAIGRDFDASNDRPNGLATIILSDGVWRSFFGADSAIIGRAITLDDLRYTVVGVMPRGFESVPGSRAEVWTLLQYPFVLPSEGPEWGHNLRMIGRMRAGITVDQARRELAAIASVPVPEFARPPWSAMKRGLLVRSLQDDATRGVKPALLAVLGAVLLVLLIACVNVANLLLARGAQRRGELAMRAALGAERRRLIRQLLTESLVLAVIGGVVGIFVAQLGVRALVTLAPAELPRATAIGVNAAALVFALAISAIIGIAIGIAPAMASSRADLKAGVQEGSRQTIGGHQLTRRVLVVAEVALALVLLVNAGLLLRSLERLFAVDPGFAPAHLLTMRVQTSGQRFDDDSVTHRYFAQVRGAVQRVTGVTSVALTSELPLSGDDDQYGVHFESSPTGTHEGEVYRYAVTPQYFATMGIPIIRGRALDDGDRAYAPLAVVINQRFAKRKFPAGDALGKHLHIGPDRGPWFTIVGVAGDVRQLSLAGAQGDAVYLTPEQSWFADRELTIVARVRGEPQAFASSIKSAIWSVDKTQPILRVQSMDDVVSASAAERHFALVVFEVFAIVALMLAATGIYGVLSGSVTERMREIGVRSALGASSSDILSLVMRQGMVLTMLGVAIGLIGAVAGSRLLVTLLFGVSRVDSLTYTGVVALLVGVSAIACWLPASRASKVDPAIALRSE